MRITTKCDACGFTGAVRDAYEGKAVRCPKCRARMVVGNAPAPAPVTMSPVRAEDKTVKAEDWLDAEDKVLPGEPLSPAKESGVQARSPSKETMPQTIAQPIPASPARAPISQSPATIKTSHLVIGLALLVVIALGVAAAFLKVYSGRAGKDVEEVNPAVPEEGVTEPPRDTRRDFSEGALVHVDRGLAATKQNDLAKALVEFSEAIRLEPNVGAAYRLRAIVHKQKGDGAAALADLNQAIQLDPKDSQAYTLRAELLLAAGKYAEAISDCTNALTLNPKNTEAHLIRGDALLATSSFEEAASDYTELLRKDQNLESAFRKRAQALLLLGNKISPADAAAAAIAWGKAIADSNEALRLNADDAAALETRCRAQFSLGKTAQAVADANALIRLNPKSWLAYQVRGMAANEDRKQAIADFTQALELNPKDHVSLRERGIAHFYLENYKQAGADLTAAIGLHAAAFREHSLLASSLPKPKPLSSSAGEADAEALYFRGRSHFATKNFADAIADFTAAIKADPKFARAYAHRSLAHSAKGDKARAKKDRLRAIKLGLVVDD